MLTALLVPTGKAAAWATEIQGPVQPVLQPLRAIGASGVTDPGSALSQDGRPATLALVGGQPSYLDLDFGLLVMGELELVVSSASDPAPFVELAFSETRGALAFASDHTTWFRRTAFLPASGGETRRLGFGCRSYEECSDGPRPFRYVRVFLRPRSGQEGGLVRVDAVRAHVEPTSLERYRGWFQSSDPLLNRIWWSSVYTLELATQRFEEPYIDLRLCRDDRLRGARVILDGGKRDRCPYVADLAVAALSEYVSHADHGLVGLTLDAFGQAQSDDGYIPASFWLADPRRFIEYPGWWVIALRDYALYSGDLRLVDRQWQHLRRLLDGWLPAQIEAGLVVNRLGRADYALIERTGVSAYDNAVYVEALRAGVALASALGDLDAVARWSARAGALSERTNALLWDDAAGAYRDGGGAVHPQDGNALALIAGVADHGRALRALAYRDACCRRPWGNALADTDDWDGYPWGEKASERVYPFISTFEVRARFELGRAGEALEQLRRTWGWMLAEANGGPGTMWEAVGNGGAPFLDLLNRGVLSMAHGWSTGPASLLSNYVLGVRPTSWGFETFTVEPQLAELSWARGQVWSPRGAIEVSWARKGRDLSLLVRVPASARARVGIPLAGKEVVRVNGRAVWPKSSRRLYQVSGKNRRVYVTLGSGEWRLSASRR